MTVTELPASDAPPGRRQGARPFLPGSRRFTLALSAVLAGLLLLLPADGAWGIDRVGMTGILLVLIFAYAWHPVAGVLGELSLGHLVVWGAGAYLCVVSINAGLPVVVTMLLAGVVGGLLAFLLILFADIAKLTGLYVAGFGLVLVFLCQAIITSWDWIGGGTGKMMEALPWDADQVYIATAVFAIALIVINGLLLTSRRGRVWLAIKDEVDRVPSTGWAPATERAIAYTLSGVLCGVGGSLHGLSIGFVSSEINFSLTLIILPLLCIYVGGAGTTWGPLLGVILFEGLAHVATSDTASPRTAQLIVLAEYVIAMLVVLTLASSDVRGRLARGFRRGGPTDAGGEIASQHIGGRSVTRRSDTPVNLGEPLQLTGISKHFGGIQVITDLSLEVMPGEIVSLVGPNGAGKSTLCNIVAGSIRPDRGSIHLGSAEVTAWSEHRRSREGLARAYQTPRVFTSLTIEDNLTMSRAPVDHSLAVATLSELSVADTWRSAASATLLERRMIEFGRLVANPPKWALLDEPLAGLSPSEHHLILDEVRNLAARGTCVLLIEHLIPAIVPVTDRMIVLHGGRLIADGEPEEVLRDHNVVEAYLGQAAVIGLP